MKSTKNLIPKVLKENMSDPKEDSKELGNLEEALGKFGIEVTKFRDQYGVDPSKIVEFRETKKGEVIFLCQEETPDGKQTFYILKASQKTDDWKRVVSEYKKE